MGTLISAHLTLSTVQISSQGHTFTHSTPNHFDHGTDAYNGLFQHVAIYRGPRTKCTMVSSTIIVQVCVVKMDIF